MLFKVGPYSLVDNERNILYILSLADISRDVREGRTDIQENRDNKKHRMSNEKMLKPNQDSPLETKPSSSPPPPLPPRVPTLSKTFYPGRPTPPVPTVPR